MRHGITSRLCVCSGSNNNVCKTGKKYCLKWDSNPRLQMEIRTLDPLIQRKQCLSLTP